MNFFCRCVAGPHTHGGRLFNFEQFGCPGRNNGAHSVITVWKKERWWQRRKPFLSCWWCSGSWPVKVHKVQKGWK